MVRGLVDPRRAPMANLRRSDGQQLSQPRVAEMVADMLRARIVDGDLRDGDLLPKQDELVDEYRVSRPALREAMRILETEGLISVRRGNVGGAVIHAPNPDAAAYMLGLVLQTQKTELSDLGIALRVLEPACAALCAEREDRAEAVVPQLRALYDMSVENVDDGAAFTRLARKFHDHMVAACGNNTLILVIGALEALWSHHEATWAEYADAHGEYPERRLRQAALKAHSRIIDAVEDGDRDAAARLVAKHLAESQTHVLKPGDPELISLIGVSFAR
jgi:GntR family transcriptional regulator, transcriptional repressor for pyruvate dehydrogenase complex